MRGVAAGLLALGVFAGSDLLAFYRASSFERAGDNAAPAVARRWSELLERHPSLPTFWPALARQARLKQGRVAGQSGGHPGGQRHRPRRSELAARDSSRTRRRNWPPRSGRSKPPRNRFAMTSAGRPSRQRPCRWPPSTTRRPRWRRSTHSSASFPTPPAAPRRSRSPGRSRPSWPPGSPPSSGGSSTT